MRLLVLFNEHIGVINAFLFLFILINIFTFFLYYSDKKRAINNKKRISENRLIFFTLCLGGIGALIGMIRFRHKTKKTKFKVTLFVSMIIIIIPMIHIVYSLTLGRTLYYNEITFYSENWPEELNGYRIGFISDIHTASNEEIRSVINHLNTLELDLFILGGDFSMKNNHYRDTLREIAKLNTSDGIFGVEGNHDYVQPLFREMRNNDIIPLDNEGFHIRDNFFLAGTRDLWKSSPDIKKATENALDYDFILLVTHNPDVTMRQSTEHIDLTLAGHTHGGHVRFFQLPFLLLFNYVTNYGTRFSGGFAESFDNTPVFVSTGFGDYYGWPRMFTRPEVVIITMKNK